MAASQRGEQPSPPTASKFDQYEDPENVLTLFLRQLRTIGPIIQLLIMGLVFVLAFCVRVFSVIKYESVIHEFDPWFNFRSTKYMD